MTATIIIAFCVLLLIAYIFDLTASKTRIPSVIVLLLMGWGVKQLTAFFGYELPDISALLPVLGTIGLILIVLEGSLELELNRSKLPLVKKSFIGALLPILLIAFILAYFFAYNYGGSLVNNLINAIPFCVISSAIAIPSVVNSSPMSREFVIYESSLSDILGILFFNFLVYNDVIDGMAFGAFISQFLIMVAVSMVAALGLAFLLNKIDHHVKFIPVILLVILIYTLAKIFHLPSLIFVLIFGLFVGNIDELRNYKWIRNINTDTLSQEILKLKELNVEVAFLIRSLFFLLFGFLMDTRELLNVSTFAMASFIVALIYSIRFIQLKISGLPMVPLLFIAPRGLITVLLFLSIAPQQAVPFVNKSLVIQVVILSAMMMMIGLINERKESAKQPH